MNIFAIETSCDDTCCAFFCDNMLLSHIVISQDEHYKHSSGVIPQIASEQHFLAINSAIKKTLSLAGNHANKIDVVAFTKFPGLKPSLFVGEVAAQTLARIHNSELVPINHLHAHSFSILINSDKVFAEYPVLSLVISGGHTNLFLINDPSNFKLVAQSSDDSIGECWDKVGSELGFLYPGGRNLDEFLIAHKTNCSKKIKFPTFYCDKANLRFSFSGLKSHCLRSIRENRITSNNDLVSLIMSLFTASSNQLTHVIQLAITKYKFTEIWITGGVSASRFIRRYFRSEISLQKYRIRFPKRQFSTDNAAMVGCIAYNKLKFPC